MSNEQKTLEDRLEDERRAFADASEDDDFVNDPERGEQFGGEDPAVDTASRRQFRDDRDRDDEPEADRGGEDEDEDRRYGSFDDDLAEKIAEELEASQTSESREFDGDASDDRNILGKIGEAGEEGETGDPAAAAGEVTVTEHESGGDNVDDPLVEWTVRGKTEQIRLSELRAKAQMNEAADSYLNEAKTILKEAREFRDSGERPAAKPDPAMSDAGKEARRKLHEVIAYGSEDEIEQAFSDFATDVTRRAVEETQAQLRQNARDQMIAADLESSQTEIRENFAPMLGNDAALESFKGTVANAQKEIMARLVEKLPAAQQEALARHKITPDGLRAMTSQKAIWGTYVNFLRRPGYNLPPMSQVLRGSAAYTVEGLKLPAGNREAVRGDTHATESAGGRVRVSSDRQSRKEGITPNPTRASGGPGRSSAPRRTSEESFHEEALAEMRDAGYRVPRRR